MNFNKIIFLLTVLVFLNGCIQSTALMGPGVTIATSGNIAQAGFQYGTNKVIENQTGKNTLGYITDTLNENINEKNMKEEIDNKKFHENFKNLVKKKIYKTRSQISFN